MRRLRRLRLAVTLTIVLGAGAASAQTQSGPGVGPSDARAAVDVTQPPWASVVRINTEAGTHCTGAVIGARTIVTAAHCLVAPRTGRLVQAGRVHVLVGYARGEFTIHARGTAIEIGAGFEPTRRGPPGADWAILHLDRALPTAPLPFAPEVRAGTAAMLGGWQRDRAHVLLADTRCTIEAKLHDASGPLLKHDCGATSGASGSPLLVRDGGGWAIAGIAVLAQGGARGGLAVAAAGIAPHAPVRR